jgi:hypothetical protein
LRILVELSVLTIGNHPDHGVQGSGQWRSPVILKNWHALIRWHISTMTITPHQRGVGKPHANWEKN